MRSIVFLLILVPFTATGGDESPYAGQEQRAIKSLSAQEVDALRRGDGMGFAKAAELNQYPGPKHVLELAAELDRLFAAGTIDADSLKAQLSVIGELQAQLRFVHLEAHLQQTTILDRDQVTRYVNLRGYHGAHAEHH